MQLCPTLLRYLSCDTLPLTKSKLALMSLGKAWHAAMLNPEVHQCPMYCTSRDKVLRGLGPTPPKLQAAILAPCSSDMDVTFDME